MRVCPKCGYKDPAYWRHVRHRLLTDYCHISDLDFNDPELAAIIREKKDVILRDYIYHFVEKSNIVQRIHISDSRDGQTIREPEQEKHLGIRFNYPDQTKLVNWNGKQK